MFKKTARWLIPEHFRKLLMNFKTLSKDYGQWESIKRNMCIDAQKNPIPWYTYPAIEYLKQLDISDKNVFEFGSGNSSLFWAVKGKEVISVEHNNEWCEIVSKNKLSNQQIVLFEKKQDYISYIVKLNRKFDIIIIDGKYRLECATNAIKCFKEGGMIILDNSDWFPETSEFLRSHDLIEVDFSGFGPINNYTWTTSLYFDRSFRFGTLLHIQPYPPIGGVKQYGENEGPH